MNPGYSDSDLLHPAYRQGKVNIAVEFSTHQMNSWKRIDTQGGPREPIFSNANMAHAFDIHSWDPLFTYEAENDFQFGSSYARILASLNGASGDDLISAQKSGGDSWLAAVMTSKMRYVGHPTGNWDDTKYFTTNFPLGAQIVGVRPFYASKESPLNELLEMVAPTISEAQEYVLNPPKGVTKGKVPALLVPFKMRNIPENFAMMLDAYTKNRTLFDTDFPNANVSNMRMKRALDQFQKSALMFGITFVYALVRDRMIDLHIPLVQEMRVTTDAANTTLDMAQTENWLASLAAKLGLLPNTNYLQIQRNITDPTMVAKVQAYAKHISATQFPGNDSSYYFATDTTSGQNPGYDILARSFLTSTLYGDMLSTIAQSSRRMIITLNDWIYHSTRNIVGRVITPSQKGGFGAFI